MRHDEGDAVAAMILQANMDHQLMKLNIADRDTAIRSWSNMLKGFRQRDNATVLLATQSDTGALVGMIGWERLENGEVNLEHLYAVKSGLGAGSKLIRRMMNVIGDTPQVNVLSTASAIGFYHAMGFEKNGSSSKKNRTLSAYRINLWQMCPGRFRPRFNAPEFPAFEG